MERFKIAGTAAAADADGLDENDYLDGQGPDPQEAAKREREALFTRLDAFGQALAATRSEAIEGREASGIEREWLEDEEFYEGIDDANRRENAAWRSKPMGQGSVDTSERSQPTGSTVFPNITRPYCDAASARTADMLLPVDDVSWAIEATPIPDLVKISEGEFPRGVEEALVQEIADPQQREAKRQELMAQAVQQVTEAREKAEKAERRIQDWHEECQYHAHVRTVIEDSARIGTGVLKGPYPAKKRVVAYLNGELVIKEEIKPISKAIDPWNFYPDPACGQNIHNGGYTWERDDITARKLEELKGTPGYIDEQIDACLQEGPHVACKRETHGDITTGGLKKRDSVTLFEIWFFHGMAKRADYEAAVALRKKPAFVGEPVAEGEAEQPQDAANDPTGDLPDNVFVQVTMVNNRVIRMIMNPLDTGEFPYDVMVWQRRKDMPWGIGVARQVRTAQRVVTAGWRNMMDNAGRAAGPQVIVDPNALEPQNSIYEFEPWKIWLLNTSLEGPGDLDRVFRFVKVDMLQAEMQAVIELGLRLAEDATGLPMIMQGQTNSATPDTLGGMQLQDNNAGTILRRIARLFDDLVTEPHIRRYYNYLLQYGEDDEKGDFVINAMGSSALVERSMNAQSLPAVLQLANDPKFRMDPQKVGREYVKALRFDPQRFEYTDEEWQKIVEQLSQPPQDTAVQVAQIRNEGAVAVAEIRSAADAAKTASHENVEKYRLDVTQHENALERELQLLLNTIDQDVIAYQEGNKKGMADDAVKSRLAEAVMKIKAMYDLAGTKQPTAGLPAPPAEPPGRAPDGQAYPR